MAAKVIIYITRTRGEAIQLLVLEHADVEAGVQVPKGTVELDETVEQAARREATEETGLAQLDQLRFIGSSEQSWSVDGMEREQWNFFTLRVSQDLPDEWIHQVNGKGDDRGMRFRYYWLPLDPAPQLAGRQDAGLHFLEANSKIPSH